MKKNYLFLLICLLSLKSLAQLNCKKTTDAQQNTITTCYHKNGKPSSVETWDKIKREGSMVCYNNQGKEIINYDLRRFGGHASVYLDYYANGQISKAEYSSAPDGGIQFWRKIHYFDEEGNQTGFTDLSQPDGHPVLRRNIEERYNYNTPPPAPKNDSSAICAVIHVTNWQVVNETKSPVKVLLKAQHNMYVQLKDTMFTIKPKQSISTKNIILAHGYLKETEGYSIEITGSERTKQYVKIMAAPPTEAMQQKTYHWRIISRRLIPKK